MTRLRHAWLGLALVLGLAWWIQPAGSSIRVTTNMPALPLSVANGGTGLASGTSGGILGYTASGTLASSVALTVNALILGGGAGATPTPLANVAAGQVLTSGTPPAWSAAPVVTTLQGSTALIAGSGVSATGVVRMPNNGAIAARNAGDTADVDMVRLTTGNVIALGTDADASVVNTLGVALVRSVADAKLQVGGHIHSTGTTPTVGTCGTSPTIAGSDVAGRVVAGSGATTECTVTFGTAWATAPSCVVTSNATSSIPVVTTLNTTTLIFTYASSTGRTFQFLCIGMG